MLESVQKIACKVCLKRWGLDYDSMLHLLGIAWLSTHRQFPKLVLLYSSLVLRPFPPPVFDRLQYANTEGEGLGDFVTCGYVR